MKNIVLLIATFLVATACSTIKVTSDYDGSVDFSKYKTFKVMHFVNEEDLENNTMKISELNRKRTDEAISSELSIRGFAPGEAPDAIFLYAVDIDMQKSYSAHTNYVSGGYYGYRGRYYGGYGYGMGSAYTDVQEHEHLMGKLRISMIDAKTKELLWTGSAANEIKQNTSNPEKRINKVVARMMLEFPIGIQRK